MSPPVLTPAPGLRVRGGATPEELAAVLAVLRRRRPEVSAYEKWRATRLAALRRPR